MLEMYRCSLCGNIVIMAYKGGGTLTCCGQEMELLKPNTVDAAQEKHVPVVEVNGNEVKVKVGSVAHPMEEKHYIQWIYIHTEQGGQRKALKPGDKPEATFLLAEGDKLIATYEYCNLHGLWMKE